MKKLSEVLNEQHITSLGVTEQFCEYENPTILDLIEANNLDIDVLSDFDFKLLETFMWNRIRRNYDIFRDNVVYESLSKSYDTDELLDKIHDRFEDKLSYLGVKSETKSKTQAFTLFAKDKELEHDEDFKSLLNLYNYFISSASNEYGCRMIYIEPYKPEEKTDYIYNNCQGIIYRCVDKKTLEKVLKVGLVPHHDKGRHRYYPKYTYVVADTNKEKLKKTLSLIGQDIQKTNLHILKIDLNKYKHKLRFFVDPASLNYDGYFTREYIPRYCLKEISLKDI